MKIRTLIINTAVTVFLLCQPLFGGQVFISMSGNDKAPGTRSHPVYSFAKAETLHKAGDEIVILGRYTQPVVIQKYGTLEAPMVITGYGDGVLDGCEKNAYGIYAWGDQANPDAGYFEIKDLKIINCLSAGIFIRNLSHIHVHNMTMERNGGMGMVFRNGKEIEIDNSIVARHINNGICLEGIKGGRIYRCLTSLTFKGADKLNAFHKTSACYGIYVTDSSRITITRTSSFLNTKAGLRLNACSDCIVKNNIFHFNGYEGMDLNVGATRNKVFDNIFYLNGFHEFNIKGSGKPSTHNEIYHNLFYSRNTAIRCNNKAKGNVFRNNVICMVKPGGRNAIELLDRHNYGDEDFDHDLIYVPSGKLITVTDRGDEITTLVKLQESGYEANGIFVKPAFINQDAFDYRLRVDSPGRLTPLDLGLGNVRGPEMEWFGPRITEISMQIADASSGKDSMANVCDGILSTTWSAETAKGQYLLFEIAKKHIGLKARLFRTFTASLQNTTKGYIKKAVLQIADTADGPFETVWSGDLSPPDIAAVHMIYYHYQICRVFALPSPVKLKRFVRLVVKSATRLSVDNTDIPPPPAMSEFALLNITESVQPEKKENEVGMTYHFTFNKMLSPVKAKVGHIVCGKVEYESGVSGEALHVPHLYWNVLRYENIKMNLREGGVSFYLKKQYDGERFEDLTLFALAETANAGKRSKLGKILVRFLRLPHKFVFLFGGNRLDKTFNMKKNEWYRIHLRWSASRKEVSLDIFDAGGRLDKTCLALAQKMPRQVGSYALFIGNAPGGVRQFIGLFDEFRIYDFAIKPK